MNNKTNGKLSKIPQNVVIIAALVAVVGISGLALWLTRSEPKADAAIMPRAARIERVEGEVGIARTFDQEQEGELEWADAVMNAPLTTGDRIYAQEGARTSVAFTGRNFARLDSGASMDVLSLADNRTQLALRDGSAFFDLGELGQDELFEVATPNGAVQFEEPGLYQLGFDDQGSTLISVLSGVAQVVGLAGSGEIGKGEMLTLAGQAAAQVLMSKLAPDYAGGLVDDYYGYRYSDYDGRYRSYDRYLDDPYYYEPYRRSVSYKYVDSYDVPGLYDLDQYGDWVDVDGHGHCWAPRVSSEWAPYRDGYWETESVWGPTWVSSEPWGWAPYHYGRWANVSSRGWVWVPERQTPRYQYSPALVAFVPLSQTNQIAWVPLAPGERYIPRYYDRNFQPRYLAPVDVVNQYVSVQRTYINMNVPQAITVVPVDGFTSRIDPYRVARINQQLIAQSRAVIDPYAYDNLRHAAVQFDGGRRRSKKFMRRELEQRLLNTPVVASAVPVVPSGHNRMLESLHVQQVTDKQRKNRLKFERNGQVITAGNSRRMVLPNPNASEVAQERGQRIAALKTQAAQGNQEARREMKQLRKQEKREAQGIRTVQAPAVAGQGQPNQSAREMRKAQKRLERAGRTVNTQQQVNANNQVEIRKAMKRQRKAERKQQQPSAARQQSQLSSQPQNRRVQASQQSMTDQARQQRKAQKQAARAARAQQQQVAAPQPVQRQQSVVTRQAVKQQRKAERRAASQASQPQPQVNRAVVQRQPVQKQQRQQVIRQQSAPAAQGVDRAQRKAEKQARKAAKKQ